MLALSILVVDIVLVVVQLALEESFPVYVEELIEILTLLFSAYFCAEVSLRIIGQGWVRPCGQISATFYTIICTSESYRYGRRRWLREASLALTLQAILCTT